MKRIILSIILLFLVCRLSANEYKKFGISLNYPGVGLKYQFINRNLLELRFQFLNEEKDETSLFGFRYYRTFDLKRIVYYLGAELSLFDYKLRNLDCSSAGYILGVFLGIEKFVYKTLSLNLDIGPYFAIANVENITETEFDFVLNASINFYFGR